MRLIHLLFALLVGLQVSGELAAAEGPRTIVPVEKDRNRHEEFLTVAKAGGVDLLFIGDSITDGWRSTGKSVWEKFFLPLKAANFGIGGDRTEHVIWRLRNDELVGIHPKVAVVMIGTNNAGDPAADVAQGIKVIITEIQQRSPGTRILLLGIFPRNEQGADPLRKKNDEVNKLIAAYATPSDPKRIVFMDIGPKFLTPDLVLSKDIMPDLLHPNVKGYQIWAEAINDMVKLLLQEDPGHLAPSFVKPSASPKVAKIEESIVAGNIVIGSKSLDKLSADKDPATAEAAKASLAVVVAWKESVDAEITNLRTAGDVFTAGEMATTMAGIYTGEVGKAYKEQAAELRKDPTYAAGKELKKLTAMPYEARKDPRFAKLVEAFVKKYPTGFYAQQAQALLK